MKRILIALILFPSILWAQSCPTKNLMTIKDSPFNKIPVYNQDGSGTCYAYTASQLANYYLLKNKKTTKLEYHPLQVALQYAGSYKTTSITSGVADIALDKLIGKEYCSYSSVTSSLQKLARDQKMTDHEIIGFVEQLSLDYSNVLYEYGVIPKSKNSGTPNTVNHPNKVYKLDRPIVAPKTTAKTTVKKFTIPKSEPLKYELPLVKIDNTFVKKNYIPVSQKQLRPSETQLKNMAITRAIASSKPYVTCSENNLKELASNLIPLMSLANTTMFKKMLIEDCQKTAGKTLPVSHVFAPWNGIDKDFKDNLRNHFAKNSSPLGIRYCSEVLTTPTLDGIKNDPSRARTSNIGGKCGMHASLLVGSRPANNSCEYLLRNTWGAGYGSWTQNWKCDCKDKKTGAYFSNCKKGTHPTSKYEVIGCWVSEDKLVKNIYGTQWLE